VTAGAPAAPSAAGGAARNHAAAAVGAPADRGKDGNRTPHIGSLAAGAGNGRVDLAHRAQGFEPLVTVLAHVLVNRHGNLETMAC
jgi:hypothetical protein